METSNQESQQMKRDIAVKTRIKFILEGKYVKEEGWKPNYIITSLGENISRVNIMGVVVSDPVIDERSQSIVVDDGSDRVQLRSFEGGVNLSRFVLGDIVNIIGKPREYMGSKYLIPEIVKLIKNNKWLEVRKKELELKEKVLVDTDKLIRQSQNKQDMPSIEEDIVEERNRFDVVIQLVKDMDKGDGVFIEDIVGKFKDKEGDKIINTLLEQGDIFEIQPGKVKILE
jgi:RPA family protein